MVISDLRGGVLNVTDTRGGVLTLTDPRGGVVIISDLRGGVLNVTDPRGGVPTLSDPRGGIFLKTGPKGRCSVYPRRLQNTYLAGYHYNLQNGFCTPYVVLTWLVSVFIRPHTYTA